MYSLKEALKNWEEAGKYGSKEDRLKRAELWKPYYSFLAKKRQNALYRPSPQAVSTVDFLFREGVLEPSDKVLDLGAGMGSYTVELAKRCRTVTAVDLNADALAVLKNSCLQAAVNNVKSIESHWETFRTDEIFDVSFSAMCPAICNMDEILRLEKMTKRSCCLLTVTHGSYDKCRKEMMKELSVTNPGGMLTDAIHYMNVLYLMGRRPNMKCSSQTFASKAKPADLIEQYRIYFRIFGIDDSISVPFMEEFLSKLTENGEIQDESRINYALIYWDVPGKE